MKEIGEIVANNIAHTIETQGITSTQLAKMAGKSPAAIRKSLHGIRSGSVTLRSLQEMAILLNVDIIDFFKHEEVKEMEKTMGNKYFADFSHPSFMEYPDVGVAYMEKNMMQFQIGEIKTAKQLFASIWDELSDSEKKGFGKMLNEFVLGGKIPELEFVPRPDGQKGPARYRIK